MLTTTQLWMYTIYIHWIEEQVKMGVIFSFCGRYTSKYSVYMSDSQQRWVSSDPGSQLADRQAVSFHPSYLHIYARIYLQSRNFQSSWPGACSPFYHVISLTPVHLNEKYIPTLQTENTISPRYFWCCCLWSAKQQSGPLCKWEDRESLLCICFPSGQQT